MNLSHNQHYFRESVPNMTPLDNGHCICYTDHSGNIKEESQVGVMEIPLERITVDPERDYNILGSAEICALARDIEINGLREPIFVREQYSPNEELPTYIIIDGEKRYHAVELLGHKNINAVVIRQADYLKWKQGMLDIPEDDVDKAIELVGVA